MSASAMPRRWLDRVAIKDLPPIVWGTVGLVAVSAVFTPQVLSGSSLNGMLPLAAVLSIAALGQTLVIQQRGFDLSIPGAMTLSAVVVTRVAGGDDGQLLTAVLLALAAGVAVGVTNAALVSWVGVTPLVATLGVNALASGAVRSYSGGVPTNAAPGLNDFALGSVAGVPNTVIVAIVLAAAVATFIGRSTGGRRFVASGENPRAARAAGVRVNRYVFAAYVISGFLAAVAGILLAGFLRTPSIDLGQPYLLSTIAAVVLGGTLLTGGRGRPIGTVIGALFLTLLVQFVITLGAPTSVQFIVQAVVIGVAVAIQRIDWPRLFRAVARRLVPSRAADEVP